MKDNIGGIISVQYCFISEIALCSVMKNGILIELKSGKEWKYFPAKIGNIEIDVTQQPNVVLDIWAVVGKIRCPRNAYENTREMILFRIKRKILVKYTTSNNDVLVVGDIQNPVNISQKLIPGINASEYSGVEYSLSGSFLHPQLPLL